MSRPGSAALARLILILTALGLSLGGCSRKDGPIVVVTASYPGSDSQTVADAIAAPIEQQIHGVEGLVRLESESTDDGGYLARLLRSGVDPQLAVGLVQNRVQLADPILPQEARRAGISVKVAPAGTETKSAAICLIDNEEQGPEALQRSSAAVKKRLAAEGVVVNPELFPVPVERKIVPRIDRGKCARAGVTEADVRAAIRAAGRDAGVDTLRALTVASASGQPIPLGSVAEIQETTITRAVFRVNLYPAVRISGLPPEGRTPAQAAAKWVKLAEAEIPKGFAVENLTAK